MAFDASPQEEKTTSTELPDKLSELILVALADLERCEAMWIYKIDMMTWHNLEPTKFGGARCHVCFAGVVMAQTKKVPLTHQGILNEDSYEGDKFVALDAIRQGKVADALRFMRQPQGLVHERVHVPTYESNPFAFKSHMRWIAEQLDLLGL